MATKKYFADKIEEVSNTYMSANGLRENNNLTHTAPSQSLWNKSAIKYFDGSGKKQLIAVLLITGGLYYAYSKGVFKK